MIRSLPANLGAESPSVTPEQQPSQNNDGNEPSAVQMALLDVLKLIFLPALIALLFYAIITYILLPLYRNYFTHQYLPLGTLETVSESTSGLRSRIYSRLERWLVPSNVRWQMNYMSRRDSSGDEMYFGEEEGESMVGFDVGRAGRGRGGGVDSERRLSRDLEQGFRDSDSSSSGSGSGDEERR